MNTALLPIFAATPKAHGEAGMTLLARIQHIHLQRVPPSESHSQWADTEISPLRPQ
ncbi:MAG: hypothetical protein JWQ07_3659 [Ramlibacter sp.]|nr:hypothetical protein [Ramlibacter sp.]